MTLKKEEEERIAEDKSSLIPETFSQDSVSGKLNLSTLFLYLSFLTFLSFSLCEPQNDVK